MPFKRGRANSNYKHGQSRTKIYGVWAVMRDRCINPNNPRWHRYGGRGITVCKRWDKFENFKNDMGPRPKGWTLERIKNDGGYTPANCVWAPLRVQYRNRSTVHMLTYRGKTMCLTDWAKHLGLTYNTFYYRWKKGQVL